MHILYFMINNKLNYSLQKIIIDIFYCLIDPSILNIVKYIFIKAILSLFDINFESNNVLNKFLI